MRRVVLAATVLAAALAAWLLLRPSSTSPSGDPSVRAPSAREAPPPAALEGAPPRPSAAEDAGMGASPERREALERLAAAAMASEPEPEGLAIEGTVVGPSGDGLPGIHVQACRPIVPGAWNARFPPDSVSQGMTDWDGRYRIPGLEAGTYDLRLEGADAFPPPGPVTADAGARADFRLRRGVSVVVRVRDDRGAPIRDAWVTAVRSDAPSLEAILATAPVRGAKTDAEGVARIAGLEAQERYGLGVHKQGFAHRGVEEWSPADTTVTLARLERTTTRGVVRDPEGRPLPDVGVYATYRGDMREVVTREDGTFSFEDPPGLEGRIAALHPDEPAYLALRTRGAPFTAGTGDIVLVLERGADLSVRLEMPGGWTPGKEAHATLYRESPDARGCERRSRIHPDGRIRFRGLDPRDNYLLWIHDPESGRFARLTGVRAGGAEIPAGLAVGLAISGRCAVPPRAMIVVVNARGPGVDAQGILLPDGRYEVRGLPPGGWDVSACAFSNEMKEWRAEMPGVPAGGTADLELKPEK